MYRTLLDERVWNQQQSWYFETVYELTPPGEGSAHKVRVFIRRNAYDAQSHLKVELWNGTEWKQIRYFAMTDNWQSHQISYVDKKPSMSALYADRDELLDQAEMILS